MAWSCSRPVLPAHCAGVATPGPAPPSMRARVAASSSSHWRRVDSASTGGGEARAFKGSSFRIIAYTTVVSATIISPMASATPVTTKAPPRPQGCTNLKLRQLMRRVARHYDAEVGKTGLRGTQYSLLSHVVKLGPIRPVDLAAAMNVDASTLSRNLQPLAAAGWLVQEAGADAR